MFFDEKLWIATAGDKKISILQSMANRHGLIAGATGTGKTVTLKVIAESFADAGVPVFLADVKGDLAGMCKDGVSNDFIKQSIEKFNLENAGFRFKNYPVRFWDIFGERGLPLRTTVSEFGPILLAKLLDLNQTQTDILTVVFKIADDSGLLILDLKDLKAMLNYAADNSELYKADYGNIATQSVNTVIRSLVALEDLGADKFFGEPALDIHDWFKTDKDGYGLINIMDSKSLINNPTTYSTFMLWMLSELFEVMPEVGDADKPKVVFFFDEAHLLFDNIPKALLQKVEQVMKLIRSKGIGVYFITQNPRDIPDSVLAQLGNKVQHALRAYTPADQKGVKAAAESFRTNPDFDTTEVISELKTGQALVSFIQADGSPSIVEKAFILPPQSLLGTIEDTERDLFIINDELYSKYSKTVDRESAYELLLKRAEKSSRDQLAAEEKVLAEEAIAKEKLANNKQNAKTKAKKNTLIKKRVASVAQTAAGTVGREIGNQLGKNIGGIFGKKIGGNVGASIGRGILQTLLKF